MNKMRQILSKGILTFALGVFLQMNADPNPNQTPDTTAILPPADVPYTIKIEQAGFSLPNGIHSNVFAVHKGKWLLLAGRTNGLHTFNNNNDNFPPSAQNTVVYVVDPETGTVWSRNLTDPGSGLSQHQIDLLSVTSPQFYQKKHTLYITGGYGVDTATGEFSTKDVLTAIDIEGLMKWVRNPDSGKLASRYIRQISDPIFQVTGGVMTRGRHGLTLLMFGQNFIGFYLDSSNGNYTEVVRRFKIHDDGDKLSVKVKHSKPREPNPNYRRRDLNILPIVHTLYDLPMPGFVALSGVFTVDTGIWTIPVLFSYSGKPSMVSASDPKAFKQGMNNYTCATVGLFSDHDGKMYMTLLGGISYGYYVNGVFTTDSEFPFINQVTTVSFDGKGRYKQYLMDAEYPFIPATGTHAGNPLLFGAGAVFIQNEKLSAYNNGVIRLNGIKSPDTLLGYVVGGIQSKVGNTQVASDSAASPYIFRVTATKK